MPLIVHALDDFLPFFSLIKGSFAICDPVDEEGCLGLMFFEDVKDFSRIIRGAIIVRKSNRSWDRAFGDELTIWNFTYNRASILRSVVSFWLVLGVTPAKPSLTFSRHGAKIFASSLELVSYGWILVLEA